MICIKARTTAPDTHQSEIEVRASIFGSKPISANSFREKIGWMHFCGPKSVKRQSSTTHFSRLSLIFLPKSLHLHEFSMQLREKASVVAAPGALAPRARLRASLCDLFLLFSLFLHNPKPTPRPARAAKRRAGPPGLNF